MEKTKNSWGGVRRFGQKKTYKPFRIDNDLKKYMPGDRKDGEFINSAIRLKIKVEGLKPRPDEESPAQ